MGGSVAIFIYLLLYLYAVAPEKIHKIKMNEQ